MGIAAKFLRRPLRRGRPVLPPPVPPPMSSSPISSFSWTTLFHNGKIAEKFCCPSNPRTGFYNQVPFRTFSWFTQEKPMGTAKTGENSAGSFEETVEFNPVEVLEMAAAPPSAGVDTCSGVTEEVFDENSWCYYPISSVISILDGLHGFTGLPWWVVISTSTVVLRSSLLPVLILQLKKMAKFAAIITKVPPPMPRPLSWRSFRELYWDFNKKKKELGCPSYLWNFAFFSVQLPCFLLWMSSIRRMCLDHHPGFDTGGTLWFQNLTDCPHGIAGFTFPTLIAVLHYITVQISFQTVKHVKLQGILGLLAKYYKVYLDILSVPLFFIGFYIPQGSLVYWVTNSSFTLIQQLCLRHPKVRLQLGLPNIPDPAKNKIPIEEGRNDSPRATDVTMPIESVSPGMLLDLALQDLAAGHQDKALILLRHAIKKDPELVQALVAIGQILCSRKLFAEAAEYFEQAIDKSQEKEIGLLVIALFGAGVSRIWEGKNLEGIDYLKRIAGLKEPDKPEDKACYYKGLVMLGRFEFLYFILFLLHACMHDSFSIIHH
ncbi:ALBINO3-like protein 3, mitochondrial [Apostasia shenzhenica]|uniref:ALBINO3-like protein 3, mitochondrial n=1 Tax=Apostasia shenzhenica TaxID=1088818 RepID=A0A2I0B0J2_9ASPA|nr:ALBINO3-like protein 3, mitochondrial [Apostasia shenzhenica]